MSTSIQVLPDAEALARTVAQRLTLAVHDAVQAGRTPRVVLTGGTIAGQVYEQLGGDTAWDQVEWYWGDERFVPAGHEDRNDRQAHETFLDRLGVTADRVHAMPAHGCDQAMADAARAYAEALPDEPFDVVLLGVGPDGHVASLFPHHDASLHETQALAVAELDSPKPPAQRISLTFPALNRTRETWFIASGEGKAEAVARALAAEGTVEQTPARGARGIEQTIWFLDDDAASAL